MVISDAHGMFSESKFIVNAGKNPISRHTYNITSRPARSYTRIRSEGKEGSTSIAHINISFYEARTKDQANLASEPVDDGERTASARHRTPSWQQTAQRCGNDR